MKSLPITKRIAEATSAAVPARGIGWLRVAFARNPERASPSIGNIGVSMTPGDTTLIRRGASSGATPRAKPSTALPTVEIAMDPGLHLRAGYPLTRTMAPSSVMCAAPRRTELV